MQKYLAQGAVASRRAAERLITEGAVEVDGVVITELGYKVDDATARVKVNGKAVKLRSENVYILLNKPKGVLTTMRDDKDRGRDIIANYVPLDQYPGLFPVGRLDKDTTGLIIFTTDGNFAHKLLHPKHNLDKTYLVGLKRDISTKAVQKLEQGVELSDGLTAPAQVRLTSPRQIEITIHEGKNRQIKRMLKAVGNEVVELKRIAIGHLKLSDRSNRSLDYGCYRLLTESEICALGSSVVA